MAERACLCSTCYQATKRRATFARRLQISLPRAQASVVIHSTHGAHSTPGRSGTAHGRSITRRPLARSRTGAAEPALGPQRTAPPRAGAGHRNGPHRASDDRRVRRASGAAEPRGAGRAVDATHFKSGPVVAPRDADAAPRLAGAPDGQYASVAKRRRCAGVRRCRYAIDATA